MLPCPLPGFLFIRLGGAALHCKLQSKAAHRLSCFLCTTQPRQPFLIQVATVKFILPSKLAPQAEGSISSCKTLAKFGPVLLHCIELNGLAFCHETIQLLLLNSRFYDHAFIHYAKSRKWCGQILLLCIRISYFWGRIWFKHLEIYSVDIWT